MSFPAAIDLRRSRGAGKGKQQSRLAAKTAGSARGRAWRFKALLIALVLAALCAGVYMLVRDSSLVQVEEVRVTGLSGHFDKNAKAAVTAAATAMTTMNFDKAKIEAAAAQFVDVASVEVTTDFPHAATINVSTRRPVVIARINGRALTLSQDGEIFTPTHAIAGVPKIDVPGKIVGNRVVSGKAHQAVLVLGGAPDILLRKVEQVSWGKLGIVVSLKNGADLYFGDGQGAKTKWKDAAAVLASEKSAGAAYLDLRVPGRVAVGGIGGAPLSQSSLAPAAQGAAAPAQGAPSTPAQQQTQAQPQQSAPQPAQQAPAPTQQAPGGAAGGAAPAQ